MVRKALALALFFSVGIFLCSCSIPEVLCVLDDLYSEEDDEEYSEPEDCLEQEPDFGTLTVHITVTGQSTKIPITLYLGNIEENNILIVDSVAVEEISYELPVNEHYSVTALYLSDQDTVLAIGSDRIATFEKTTEYCLEACWGVTDGDVNVRLRSELQGESVR